MNRRFLRNRFVLAVQKTVVFWMMVMLCFADVAPFIGPMIRPIVNAAEVTIDGVVTTTDVENAIVGPATVFISDQVGYKFYVDSTGVCVYSKTTNGGTSWGAAVTIDAQTDCASPVVWYDRWTPGDTGNFIHISTFDANPDDLWYNRLDVTTDTRLLGTTPVSVSSGSGQGGTYTVGANLQSITKGTDGTIYMGMSDGADSYIVECTTNCNLAANWVETGTSPLDLTDDYIQLVPLLGGEIMLIRRDLDADDIQSRIWNNSTWGTGWTTIDGNSVENTLFDGGIAAVSTEDGEVFLAHTSLNVTYINGSHDIRTAKYSGGSWSTTADVITNTSGGLGYVAIFRDLNNDNIYVAYNRRTTIGTDSTANVYWATSTSAMTTWSAEQGPVNTGSVDIHGIDLNYASDERVHVAWHEDNAAGNDFVMGDTIRDIAPTTVVSASGTQTTLVRASTTNFYVGGRFVIDENVATRNVTSIEITENGSVDAANGLGNVRLRYDLDTTAPYDCASESYAGSESQFGSTDTNGFSGANGVSIFTDSVSISTTSSMCVYVVLDVLKAADDQTRIDIEITDPSTDIVLSGGATPVPTSVVAITGSTTIADDVLTQTHYHWRNDNGAEGAATSRTSGTQDTAITALQQNTPVRLRLGVSNEGSTTTVPMTLRLEYSTTTGACSTASGWTDVGATNDDWNMSPSTFITDGANATNIAIGIGGVTDENTTFLAANGGLRDTSSSLGSLTFSTTTFAEAEFSIIASTTATEGSTYCFRLTDNGAPLSVYSQYAQVTIAADVTVSATGTQTASTHAGANNVYLGGAFRFVENSSSRNITSIRLTEQGTVNGVTGIEDIRIRYDLDTTAPYDCASESYAGTELQFGATSTAFASDNGTSTFTGSVAISTTQAMCAYVIYDVTEAARNTETVDIVIGSGSSDVVVSGGGSVSPSTAVNITGTTNINSAVVTQTHYHWRNDNGTETTATSRSGGVDDTLITDFDLNANVRLRFGISNEGATTSFPRRYQLEYGIKVTTCDAVSVWTDVGASNDAWNMFDSTNLTNGETTTNIVEASGGVVDENTTFVGTNGNVRDTESSSATTTLTSTEHTDLEYSITSTATTSYETTYCFRVTQSGTPLPAYSAYAELTTTPKRDFRIQRNTATITGTSTTLVAGVNYTAPASSSTAFIRLTAAHHTGAGNSATGNIQNADDVTAYILNPSNIMNSITIARPPAALNNTRVSWEIIEFIGASSTDNQIIVRNQGTTTITGTNTFATTTVNGPISDDSDVVVFITGLQNQDIATNYFNSQVTSSWSSTTNQAVFQRIGNGSTVNISFAVVEFVGMNWKIQRVEHSYNATGTVETEPITAVNSLNRTFLHTQKRVGASANQINFGHEVYLSSIGAVSFLLPAGAATTTGQVSVAWVIENTQTSTGAMVVQRGNGIITGAATEPRTTTVNLASPVNALNNSSLFTMTSHSQNTNNYPRVLADATLVSTTTYQLWSSDIDATQSQFYRTEVVQWPVVDLAIRQNYYRFYVDNDTLTPSDPWPSGPTNLGENTSLTAADTPLGDGEVIRVRTTLQISNTTLPAGFLEMKLQYALRDTTCSAVETWSDVGNIASSTIWRGYNTAVADGTAVSGNPPSGGELLISIADVGGRFVEEKPSAANPYSVSAGQDVEYDWVLQHNGAQSDATYCFRMIKTDETPLDSYNNYPQIRTAGFTPLSQNWRWYDDAENETPVTALAAQNTAPIDIDDGNSIKLRMTIDERKNVQLLNAKFGLQYSEYPDFSVAFDVVATSTCMASSTWCYFDGGGVNNATITTRVLTDADTCTAGVGAGCGTHNESSAASTGFTHSAGSAREYSFNLVNAGARVNRVYYFRAYNVTVGAPVTASTTYPSLVTKGGSLVFASASVGNGQSTEGIVTDATSTATRISFGTLPFGSSYEAAYRLSVTTNATEGYQLLMYANQPLMDNQGNEVASIAGTNAAPVSWAAGCAGLPSCFGYHAGDDSLSGNSTRFAANDTYAAFSTSTPQEVMYSSRTATTDVSDLIVRIQTSEDQPAGLYENNLVFIAIPSY